MQILRPLQEKILIYSPLRLNFVVVCICLAFLQFVVFKATTTINDVDINTAYAQAIKALVKFCALALLLLFVVTVICILISYFYYKKNIPQAHIQLAPVNSTQLEHANMRVQLSKIIRLPLVNIHGSVHFNTNHYSEVFAISTMAHSKWWQNKLEADVMLELPHTKTYHIDHICVLFRDVFGLFSIPCKVHAQSTISHISEYKQDEVNIQPNSSTEPLFRIAQQKRIDGEYLRFKKFDSSDDTRRIVWRIFARSRSLEVRAPEIFNPYADNLHYYPSFYTNITSDLAHEHLEAMLSRYKQIIYAILQQAQQQNLHLQLHTDQEHQAHAHNKTTIIDSIWQNTRALMQFVQTRKGSIIVISSLSNLEDVTECIARLHKEDTIVFAQLSQMFKANFALNILERIFLLNKSSYLGKLNYSWGILPLRFTIKSNEQELIQILKNAKQRIIYA